MIKAVLFDLDGTLINTNDLIINSWEYIYTNYLGIKADEEKIKLHFGEPLLTTMESLDKVNAKQLCEIYKEINLKQHDKLTKKIDGIEELLIDLRKMRIKIGIATSKKRELAKRGLNLFGLLEYFDVMVTVEDTEKHKPNGEPVIKACQLLNVDPSISLYVGDTSYDILCGKNAGSKTCAVKYSALPLKNLIKLKPDFLVERPEEIIDIVNSDNNLEIKNI